MHHRHRIETPDAISCIASTTTMRCDDDVGSPASTSVEICLTQGREIVTGTQIGIQNQGFYIQIGAREVKR
jgi:hypothetical protein